LVAIQHTFCSQSEVLFFPQLLAQKLYSSLLSSVYVQLKPWSLVLVHDFFRVLRVEVGVLGAVTLAPSLENVSFASIVKIVAILAKT
jgi:hypothetical protein